jgi:predicted RNA binding protein YcfA (HicA-like mRNA interferase family)
MTSFPSLSFRDLIKRVQELGFVSVRQRGSHIRFSHPDGRKTTIPDTWR